MIKQTVAITFDDAYVSAAENALPEPAERGLHSTVFVPLLGSPPSWPVEDGRLDTGVTVMPAEQTATLPSPLVTAGSHANTNPRLSRTDNLDARKETEGSRVRLQALTAQDIRLLAFPNGDHDASTIELCRSAGYDNDFIGPHPVDTTRSNFLRVKVDPFHEIEFFPKFPGAYAWVSYVCSLKRRLRDGESQGVDERPTGNPCPTNIHCGYE